MHSQPTGCVNVHCLLSIHKLQDFSCESTQSISYTVVVVNTCNIRSSKVSNSKEYIVIKNMEPFTLAYLPNYTSITIIAENSLGILYHSVNTSGAGN